MFGKKMVVDMITRSSENEADRRAFLRTAGLAGLGAVGGATLLGTNVTSASATNSVSDAAILNFALNLEYLEAEFYLYAAYGSGLKPAMTDGKGKLGSVKGGRQVKFASKVVEAYAKEIARDELAHVNFLRAALGSAKVARPAIDIQTSFTAAARAAGLISGTQTFDPYANENNFLLAAFIFEDVGVTAYKGAAPLISNKTYLGAAAGILAVEAYHAAIIRTVLYERGQIDAVQKISDARDSLDGAYDKDQGLTGRGGPANLVPADRNSIAYGRSTGEVLNVVYLTPKKTTKGGFFPHGVNGTINTSADND
ncbi:MAG TPA: ferritin-like domain-containing protein [Propionibacteriaceae bacterium]|jgi:hypothetical protein